MKPHPDKEEKRGLAEDINQSVTFPTIPMVHGMTMDPDYFAFGGKMMPYPPGTETPSHPKEYPPSPITAVVTPAPRKKIKPRDIRYKLPKPQSCKICALCYHWAIDSCMLGIPELRNKSCNPLATCNMWELDTFAFDDDEEEAKAKKKKKAAPRTLRRNVRLECIPGGLEVPAKKKRKRD